MGVLVKITCRSCGADWQRGIGSGMMHGNLEKVAGLYPEKIKQEILRCAEQEDFPSYDFEYRLASCDQCKEVVSVPVLTLKKSGMTYIGTCAQCGREAQLMEKTEKTPCPVCHKASLKVEETGLWD